MKNNSEFKGFTLIELLIVMTIIAILAGISAFALQGTRGSARDTRRRSDLEHIASGLAIYKADCNYYPNALPTPPGTLTGVSPCNPVNSNVYIQSIPDDPDTTLNYIYVPRPGACTSTGTCTRFELWASLETAPASISCTGSISCGSLDCNYCVTNP